MTTVYNVGVIVGSISAASINRKLAKALARLAPEAGLHLTEIPIVELPFYNRDLDAAIPATVATYRAAIEAADAVLFVTPEYNRSIPGVLKNAIDWASRPKDAAPLGRKPSYVVGASIGAIGTAVAQQHLRSILSFLAAPEVAQPEVYLQAKPGLLTDDGTVTNDGTRAFLLSALVAFHAHIARNLNRK